MDNEKQGNNEPLVNEFSIDTYVSRFTTDDVEFVIHTRKPKNPAILLEKLYLLRENTVLSDDEKNEEIKKIMSEYMG